ncbi:hypothetical protein ACP4OV_009884 [Aristida adscensionis]
MLHHYASSPMEGIHVHLYVVVLPIAVAVAVAAVPVAAGGGPCRESCGGIPVRYPFGIDDGCGSPYYRNMLTCAAAAAGAGDDDDAATRTLRLRTPSGTYRVAAADYSDPHLVVADPSMWTCDRPFTGVRAAPFSLDTSTRFSLSSRNEFLFFGCDDAAVIVAPRPPSCDRYPDRRCDSACDAAAYLCRNLPACGGAADQEEGGGGGGNVSCCAYRPRAAESLRAMLRHCEAYTSVYWRERGDAGGGDRVPEYGVRVDFEIPVTTRCLQCQDRRRGAGGACGFDPATRDFVCLCDDGRNSTTDCADARGSRNHGSVAVVAASVVFSISAAVGIGGLLWYIRKIRSNKVVTCGVQSNENRFF